MEEIKNKLEEMIKVAENKQKIEELDNSVKEKEKELEQLGKELSLSMIGTVDKQMKKEEVEKASEEFEKMKSEKESQQKDLNEKFENSKSDLISSIDEEMSKYKKKSEIDNLKSQKQAYEKIAENAQKTIDNAIRDFNEGKQINQAIVDNAREELKANKEKAAEIESKLKGYIELESNLEQYKDLEYLKTRIQGLRVTGIDKNLESGFVSKYFGEKENEEEQKNNVENSNLESSKDEENQQGKGTEINEPNYKPEAKPNKPSEKPEIESNKPNEKSEIESNESKNEIETKPNDNEIKNEDVQEGLNVLRDPSKEEIKAQGDKIINELGKDYKNLHFTPESVQNEGNSDKNNISIFISENDKIIKCKDKNGIINIPIEEIEDEKKDMYKRLDIGKKCRKVIKKSTGNRRLGLMLKRKVNPEIVRALDSTGNRDLIEKYIESVYNKSEFPFELKHDLSGLNIREKFKLRKYTKTEEKCGAEILGKIWNKNKTLSEGKQNVNELEQESKDEIAASVRKIIAKEKEEKENASFVQKVDGKNAEIAEKYNENNKTQNEYENMPLADLLNELEVSDTAKLTIANYANKYGEKEAKEKFEKGLAPARTRLSMKNFVNQAKEERKPGNQQIKEDTQKSDDEGR